MSSTFLTLTGESKWTDNLFEADDKYETYGFQLVLDDESYTKFTSSDSQIKVKQIEEGFAINPKRKKDLGSPRVLDKEGNPWNEKVNIGNGSKVSTILELYRTKNGVATRLEAVRVDELVEFDPENFDRTKAAREALEAGDLPF